jgi:regulator of sirC expression with transglutaminase-like and TPR domain
LNSALKRNSGDTRAYRVRGAVRERLSDYDGALSDFSKAIRRDPKDSRLFLAARLYQ